MTLKYAQGNWQSYHLKAVVWPCMQNVRKAVNEWSENRHFQRPTLCDAPSPANLSEYLHKPCYTARNLYVPWSTFLSLTVWVALQIFEQFCPKAEDANPKQIQGHSRSSISVSLKSILMGYIAQYNKCCLRCEGSEDIASERSENRHFRPPHSHLTPHLQRTPANIRIKLTLLQKPGSLGYIFAADSICLSDIPRN